MSYIGKQPRKAALTSSDIEDGIITAAKIEDGAVVAAEIASNAVTTAKINADAVTSAKIADNAVVTAAINADAVTGAKIADDAINSEHYTDGSVDTAHIADANVTTAKIADDAVTAAKINNDIISGTTALTSAPADTDEFLVSDAGTLKRIDYSLIKGGGVTEIDRWLMADQTLADAATLGNWSRHNTSITGVPHGTGMSASSGIWTFPSTGVYEITFMTYIWNGTSGTRQFIGIDIKGTNDAFSSNTQSIGTSYSNVITDNAHNNLNVNGIYDVTNTSNNKLKFVTTGQGTCGFYTTIATFKKLMET